MELHVPRPEQPLGQRPASRDVTYSSSGDDDDDLDTYRERAAEGWLTSLTSVPCKSCDALAGAGSSVAYTRIGALDLLVGLVRGVSLVGPGETRRTRS